MNAANTDFTILTASASTTLVKNITWIHEGHDTSVTLSLTKSGGTKTVIGIFAATSNISTKIWTDILPLEAGDVLFLQSTHISASDVGHCVVSYVTNTSSVSGQSIGVLTDVDLTGNASGKILSYNGNQFTPIANSASISDTDALSEGSSNLYFTDARVAANSAVTANTAKNTYPSADATKLSNIATSATANSSDATLLARANHTGTQTASTISDFDTEVSNNSAVTANSAKTGYTNAAVDARIGLANIEDLANVNVPSQIGNDQALVWTGSYLEPTDITKSVTGTAPIVSSGGSTPAISISAATTSAAGSMSAADKSSLSGLTTKYESTVLVTGPNTLFEGSSTTNDKIADVLGAAVASRDNANAKKMLGFHTGSGVYVLRGMVDAVSQINGASAGSPLWLGASGAFDSAPPTTQNHYSRIGGYFVGTGQGSEVLCYFDPSRDWVQID